MARGLSMATLCLARIAIAPAAAAALPSTGNQLSLLCLRPGPAGSWDSLPDRTCRWRVRSMGGDANSEVERQKIPARLAQMQKIMDAAPSVPDDANEPIPKISMDRVTVSFARSGGAGGQNVNKVNTKVDMRFNVMEAGWLPERIRLKLLQTEKNRINGDGEIVVSSTRTRTQKGNIEDALAKLQEMINAAAYVQPPPSEETVKRIQKLAKIENERRLNDKKKSSSKKSDRRNKGSWD